MILKIFSPDGLIFEKEVKIVTFRTVEGEMGILDKRAPMIGKLKVDKLIAKDENNEYKYMIDDGFVHCDGKNVIIVTKGVKIPKDMDPHIYMGG
ncbi:F0F1 ATP synthase subunit epsilon [Thermosipho atlanticus]|uniref:F-type H+-transporting ATPase subunit epsilon n=1 Tax=Thermosipho atlanticus DSM 15807 TaxID=1123380 RepID=A0A1M5RTC1_9BACT|nr:F0F1 ATP synthase subunit epsilon [Thermosipho atlanticus]SHH29419.1 F-type H+-transporting ATPase subunit epsilon [Thermosipho atlanticus DSM 15807]